MERGEESNHHLHESEALDVMPLRSLHPMSLNGVPHSGLFHVKKEPNTTNDQDIVLAPTPLAIVAPFPSFRPSNNISPAAGSAGPGTVKRGRGRPRGTNNSKRPFATSYNVSSASASTSRASAGAGAGHSNGPVKRGRGRSKASDGSRKVVKNIYSKSITSIPNFQGGISQEDCRIGNAELANNLLMRFDAVRRRLCQNGIRDANTTAIGTFKSLGLRTNSRKRIGPVPGVDVGDIFYCRGEMYVVGLHVATIDIEFMGIQENWVAKALAICIVSSGKNVDEARDPASLVFKGYGGTAKYGDGPSHQELDGLNLALDYAIQKNTVVRVVRSEEDQMRKNKKIYIYDGLYLVTEKWREPGENGFMRYKFKLVRVPGQKPGFKVWKDIQQWKSGLVPRPRIMLEDISIGAELSKIPLVNEVSDEKDLAPFAYVTTLSHSVAAVHVLMTSKCICIKKECGKGDGNCFCILRNGDEFPYVDKVLVARRQMVFECGSFCCCYDDCGNRMIQNGLKHKLEVFKTIECGWGLRSWDPLRAGTFICEYVGEVIKKGEEGDDDDYIFDSSRVYSSLEWNYEHELVGEEKSNHVSEQFALDEPLVISAKRVGNVARFMNHSCQPNVFWQPMKRENNGKLHIHIGLFAVKHIPPMTELRFDYGLSRGEGKKVCMCGSDFCRGSFD
ncbi:hypothetical protein AALP_AA7G162400 [Arabis alpina]|uniref:Uncharacterized protein n=1 Tax=Arabis alpina TaxID=50452 RepID=A0A087GIF9_ARAAL|nr:hypothetical protein AALP_AA7G162400 [Arabis alpina]